jgi:Raf kinase inhibitor-like YbhB/YbcL family protein
MQREETRAPAQLNVTSTAFAANRPIALKYSAYGEDQSPALGWSGLPAGATHVAILMEDPDAATGLPFVHWLAWNVPASLGGLPEGLPKEMQLADPKGLRQGRNTRGSIGYFGPRPPIGDRAHRYHVQLFALSGPLDLPLGADREMLIAALAGKVIGRGEIVGTYAQVAPPVKR